MRVKYEEENLTTIHPTPDTLLASISHFLGQAAVQSLSTRLKRLTGTDVNFVSLFVDHPDTQNRKHSIKMQICGVLIYMYLEPMLGCTKIYSNK